MGGGGGGGGRRSATCYQDGCSICLGPSHLGVLVMGIVSGTLAIHGALHPGIFLGWVYFIPLDGYSVPHPKKVYSTTGLPSLYCWLVPTDVAKLQLPRDNNETMHALVYLTQIDTNPGLGISR